MWALLLYIVGVQGAAADERVIHLATVGAPSIVFDYNRDRCSEVDIPDAPARAFRDADGRIKLFATHYVNYFSIGETLDAVQRDCSVAFRGGENSDPQKVDDRVWLSSFYTEDGSEVFAIAHNEYQGHRRPERCPSQVYLNCWYNTLVALYSNDKGVTFSRRPGGVSLIAGADVSYIPDFGRRLGASNPSNIVRSGRYYYFMFIQDTSVQRGLLCLARTPTLQDPHSWRVWDGNEFSIGLSVDGLLSERPCIPVRGLLPNNVGSIVFEPKSALYIAIQDAGKSGSRPGGVYYSVSKNLTDWSNPVLLMELPVTDTNCPSVRYGYPSILDPASRSRNFETIESRPYLYLMRVQTRRCGLTMLRDLIRVPLDVRN
jgi:hypothetical protein